MDGSLKRRSKAGKELSDRYDNVRTAFHQKQVERKAIKKNFDVEIYRRPKNILNIIFRRAFWRLLMCLLVVLILIEKMLVIEGIYLNYVFFGLIILCYLYNMGVKKKLIIANNLFQPI